MLDTLQIVLPIFAIIAFGAAAAALGLLNDRAADGLSEFVFVIAIPVLLFRTLATAPLPEAQPWGYWTAYFSALALVWWIAATLATRVFGMSGQEVPILGFATVQSNTVFVGIPLVLRSFGEAGAVPMFLLIAIHLPLAMTAATLMVERSDGGTAGKLPGMARKMLLHPIIVGILAGTAYRLTGLPLPSFAGSTMKLIADAALPTALFALGMTLRRYGLDAPVRILGVVAALKLLVQPAIVYLLAFHVLPMPPVWAAVAVLFAACPCGVNAYLLATRYKAGVALTSSALAATTALAVGTTTFWVWLVSGVK
jgi:predicted permease